MTNTDLGAKRLSDLRIKSNLTQTQIADYLNVDQSYISKYERNERQFSVDILEKLADLFGCTVEYFTNEEVQFEPIPFALRVSGIKNEDLESIAVMNKLVMNLRIMENIAKGE